MVQMGDDPTRIEATAGEAGIYPGKLLEWSGGEFLRHNTAGGLVLPIMIALESQTPDDEDDITIDVVYADGDIVYAWIPKSGDHALMWLADGETAAQHDLLESDGDGCLQVEAAVDATDIVQAIVGRCVVAVDNALGGAPARILVEIR